MEIPVNKFDDIKYRVEDYLLFCLANNESFQFLKDNERELSDAIDMFIMRKAKRIRPIILILAYNGYAKEENETVIHAAVALELMHTFALIHDDIIDNSKMRGKTPSLYHAINLVSPGEGAAGERMAMLVGDLIYNIALNELQKVKMPLKAKNAGMELLLDTTLKTGFGQLKELVQSRGHLAGITPNQILRIYDLKTAHYTFCLPFQLGALMAGVKPKDQKPLKEIGLSLGRAYQIIDDINDFSTDSLDSCNYLAALLWQESKTEEKKKLRKLIPEFNKKEKQQETGWLHDLYIKYDIIRKATTKLYNLLEEGKSGIKKLPLQGSSQEDLLDFIDSIMKITK